MFYTAYISRHLHGNKVHEDCLGHYRSYDEAYDAVNKWRKGILDGDPAARVLREKTTPFVHHRHKGVYGIILGTGDGNGIEATIVENHFENEDAKPFKVCMVFGEDAVNAFEEASPKRKETVRKAVNLVNNAGGDLVIRSFATEAERKAYLDGIYDGDGWQAYYRVSADELDFRNVPDRHND